MSQEQAISVEQVRELIDETKGNVAAIAGKLGVSRGCVYKRIKECPELKEAISDARETLLDYVESALYRQVLDGHVTAMIFWLKTQGKRRGWVERQEVTGAEGGPIEHRGDLQHLSDTELVSSVVSEAKSLVGEEISGDASEAEVGSPSTDSEAT